MESKQIVILGGGLAGSFLASELLAEGQRVVLVDAPSPGAASRVAAGLYNVITGRFGAKSWQADRLLPHWLQILEEPGYACLRPHVFPSLIYRPFKEIKEYNKWTARLNDPEFSKWVAFQEQPLLPHAIDNELGGIRILPCGWTQTGALVDALVEQMKSNSNFQLISDFVEADQVDLAKKCFRTDFGKISFNHLILCPGYQAKNHPFWPGLPIIPNKGELLLLEIPELEMDFVLSKKVYLIPLGNQQYIAGSTYYNTFSKPDPSEKGREEIVQKLSKALKLPYRILDQKAGIRPTTPDRRPILGTHPERKYVHVFSGLGTKGVLLAPYYARLMARYLAGALAEIPAEVSVHRFSRRA
jgi:glycine oxidase